MKTVILLVVGLLTMSSLAVAQDRSGGDPKSKTSSSGQSQTSSDKQSDQSDKRQ
jgi:hypothetical protein